MPRIFDARNPCHLQSKNFFIDTCVWIAIYGNGLGLSRSGYKAETYSDYYSSILNNGNTVYVNEFVISEFFNRMCKLEYDIMFPGQGAQYKKNRKLPDFVRKSEEIKELCVDILINSKFVFGGCCDKTVEHVLERATAGIIDMTDLLILKTCNDNSCVLVSDDADYSDCEVDLVTANNRVLANRA